MEFPSLQGGRRLACQITYRFPHIGRKAAWRSPRSRGAVVNVPRHSLFQKHPLIRRKGRPVGLRPAVESLTHALHFLRYRQVADPHLPQIVVHILTKPVKKPLAKLS